MPDGVTGWLKALLGSLMTIAVSLGAPFWFDLLGKVAPSAPPAGPSRGSDDHCRSADVGTRRADTTALSRALLHDALRHHRENPMRFSGAIREHLCTNR